MLYKFAVIGNPVAHSLSPIIHEQFASQMGIQLSYTKIKGKEQDFEQQVLDFFSKGGKGLNVTLPFKQRAFALAKYHTSRCQQAGAANTLWRDGDQLCSDNTDGVGFIRDIQRYIKLKDKKIVILGAGGAVRGIISPLLEKHPALLCVANRTVLKAKELHTLFPQIHCMGLNELAEPFDIIINATSTSLTGEFIKIPEACISSKSFCYDLAYTPNGMTSFVRHAKSLYCDAVDGLGMLVEQAAEAFFVWHGMRPQTQQVIDFIQKKHGLPWHY